MSNNLKCSHLSASMFWLVKDSYNCFLLSFHCLRFIFSSVGLSLQCSDFLTIFPTSTTMLPKWFVSSSSNNHLIVVVILHCCNTFCCLQNIDQHWTSWLNEPKKLKRETGSLVVVIMVFHLFDLLSNLNDDPDSGVAIIAWGTNDSNTNNSSTTILGSDFISQQLQFQHGLWNIDHHCSRMRSQSFLQNVTWPVKREGLPSFVTTWHKTSSLAFA